MITALVLLGLLLLSLAMHLSGLVGRFAPPSLALHQTAEPRLEEVIVKQSEARRKIVVVPIQGLIFSEDLGGYNLVDLIKARLQRAAEDDEVKAVLLNVDSPGGEVLAADEIYKAIARFQKESKKPVVAALGSLAASGGYYVSVPCRWIVANEMTITGSIGVIMHAYNYRGLMDKIGLRPEVFKSGKYKDMLSGDKKESEITAEERQMVQDLVNETFARFKEVVAEGRRWASEQNRLGPDPGRPLTANWTEYADGRILSGREAHRLGFVDELGNFDVAAARARKLAGVSEARLVEYREVYDFSRFLRLFGKSDLGSVKINLGADVPKLKAGRLYFLAPTFLH